MAHVPAIRRQSIRVALAATGIVAVAYLAIAGTVVAFATRDLTSQIDHRLFESLERLPGGDREPDSPYRPGPAPDRPFGGAPVLIWTIESDGTVLEDIDTPALPAALHTVAAPVNATVDGIDLRLAGAQVADDYVVVGQAMYQVTDAQRTIVLAELLIAPVLLGIVFFGAMTIGQRVAAPVEAARRRQLEFTADASHELRTPLSVIEAHTTLALAQPREAAWYRSAFERVDRESKRMRRLVEDMLWLARFDATQATPVAEPVDLGVLAAQAADRFAAIAETRTLTLRVSGTETGAVVAASPELLDRLLGVLLDNACKYAPEGGSVELRVAMEGARATVAVEDSGPGIPEDERARVFDRFHRATSDGGGAGLGLAIGDAIVRATGGRWTVGSSPAGGARFAVSWPRASLS